MGKYKIQKFQCVTLLTENQYKLDQEKKKKEANLSCLPLPENHVLHMLNAKPRMRRNQRFGRAVPILEV